MSLNTATTDQAAELFAKGELLLNEAELQRDSSGTETRELTLTPQQLARALHHLSSIGLGDTVKVDIFSVKDLADVSVSGDMVFPSGEAVAIKAEARSSSTNYWVSMSGGEAPEVSKEHEYADPNGEYRFHPPQPTLDGDLEDLFSLKAAEAKLGLNVVTTEEANSLIAILDEVIESSE